MRDEHDETEPRIDFDFQNGECCASAVNNLISNKCFQLFHTKSDVGASSVMVTQPSTCNVVKHQGTTWWFILFLYVQC